MISGAELRILSHLSKFQGNEEDKWNIPREQSLPGIAESLGVVRSALHVPLNSLEKADLVISRNARVSEQNLEKELSFILLRKDYLLFLIVENQNQGNTVTLVRYPIYQQFMEGK